MGRYYNWSYAAIAATSATDSTVGFLHRNRPHRQYIDVGNDNYVCEPIDDFQKDVVDAELNTRGGCCRSVRCHAVSFTSLQSKSTGSVQVSSDARP